MVGAISWHGCISVNLFIFNRRFVLVFLALYMLSMLRIKFGAFIARVCAIIMPLI